MILRSFDSESESNDMDSGSDNNESRCPTPDCEDLTRRCAGCGQECPLSTFGKARKCASCREGDHLQSRNHSSRPNHPSRSARASLKLAEYESTLKEIEDIRRKRDARRVEVRAKRQKQKVSRQKLQEQRAVRDSNVSQIAISSDEYDD